MMINYTNWYPLAWEVFKDSVEHIQLHRCDFLSPDKECIITCYTDSLELIDYCHDYLIYPTDKSNCPVTHQGVLYYLISSDITLPTPRGFEPLRHYTETNPFSDAPFDPINKVFLVRGILHFGLMKSLVSGMTSFLKANQWRQGLHASCLLAQRQGFLILGTSGSGKSNIGLRVLKALNCKVASDDWIDLILTEDSARAVSIDINISFNERDLPQLQLEDIMSDSSCFNRIIPHGYRNKVVTKLADVFGDRVIQSCPVSSIFYLADVDAPITLHKPKLEDIHNMIVNSSLHFPFCYPFEPQVAASTFSNTPVTNKWKESFESVREAADICIANRRSFAHHLCGLVERGHLVLHLIPKSRDVSIDKKVDFVLEQMCNNE
jgi:hypothetical protein